MERDVMRHKYLELNDTEKEYMRILKCRGYDLWDYCELMSNDTTAGDRRRCYALTKTKIEEAVMWAVKGLSA